ncbi:hypothetical protein [Aureispira anguillae]|nr:hypothetical protein [Aureispira anguillae]
MPNKYFFSLVILVFIASIFPACTKDNSPLNNSPQHPYYINFDLNGVPQSYGAEQAFMGTSYHISHLSPSLENYATDSYVPDSSTSMNALLSLHFEQHPILEADLTGLIGQQLPIKHPMNPYQTCATMHIYHSAGPTENDLFTERIYNDSSSSFVQIDSVYYHSTLGSGEKVFTISGRFDFVLSRGTVSQTANNGKFRLLFSEYQ